MGKTPARKVQNERKILVPTDFTAVTANALVHGLEIARLIGGSVCLFHVYNPPTGTIYNKEDPGYLSIREKLADCKAQLEQKYGVTIEPLIRRGNLFKAVNSAFSSVKPQLMVMGTHGKQGLQHLFGSHALRILLDCTCPALIVREGYPKGGYKPIFLPVNSETEAGRVIPWLTSLGRSAATEIVVYQAKENDPERERISGACVAGITTAMAENQISCSSERAPGTVDFSASTVDRAIALNAGLIITMTLPAGASTGYHFSDWNERLMFNTGQIPVLFIDRSDGTIK